MKQSETITPPTNHERMIERGKVREEKQAFLRELIKKTKESHPDSKMSYSQWARLAAEETAQRISQGLGI